MVVFAILLNTQLYKVRINDERRNPEKGIASFPTF